jgi:hypothetical protein
LIIGRCTNAQLANRNPAMTAIPSRPPGPLPRLSAWDTAEESLVAERLGHPACPWIDSWLSGSLSVSVDHAETWRKPGARAR